MKVRACTLGPAVARGIALICAAVVVASAASTAHAAGVVGTGTADSCTDADFDTALAGGGLVTFNCGPDPVTIDISTGTGRKAMLADTTIDGGGLVTISGGNSVQVFGVNSGVDFTVRNLTVANGIAYGGGGIQNSGGTIAVINATFANNTAPGYMGIGGGGGISNGSGSLTLINSTFVGNRAAFGGDILNAGTLAVISSTFTAIAGGGGLDILNIDGSATVSNSTFSQGSIENDIRHSGSLIVTNSTFADGVIVSYGPPAVLRNTIVSGCSGGVTDGGHNLDKGTSCGFGTANGSVSNTDPQLDPAGLQDNGGPTHTIALLPGSPAINAGDPEGCADPPVYGLDQRGYARPSGGHTQCAIGAYEPDAILPTCTGDCRGDGVVTIDELTLGVNIALGVQPADACPVFANTGGRVDIAQLVAAVNNALRGCPTTDLYVTASGTLNGDGRASNPYRRITDAVTRARAERARGGTPAATTIQLHVAPGTYMGSFDPAELQTHPEYEVLPIILNVPNLAVLGATVLTRDARGLPVAAAPESETILEPDRSLAANQYLFLVTRTADGAVGNGVTVDGFVLDGRGGAFPGADLFVDRVSGFRISNNLVQGAAFGVMTRLASGTIEGNLLTENLELGSVVTGGSLVYPATVLIRANRANGNDAHGLGNGSAGWIALRSEPGQNTVGLLEPLQTVFDRLKPEDVQNIPDTLTVTLTGNDASNNGAGNSSGGIGIRFGGIWPDFDYRTVDDSQPSTSVLTATLTENTSTGNASYGVDIEAGDTNRLHLGQFVQESTATFQGNVFTGNGRAPGLFTFNYWLTSVGIVSPYVQKFSEESTYALTDTDGELTGFDYDNPATDSLVGTVLNNTLTVNGVEVPHGTSITPPAN